MTVPVGTALATATMVEDVVATMHPGMEFVYHVGFLVNDRSEGPSFLVVHGAGQAAWQAYLRGEVTLVQRKLKPFVYEYLMIKRSPPAPKKRRLRHA